MRERAVSGRLRDPQVKEPVTGQRLALVIHLAVHVVERILDGPQLRALRRLGREGRALRFDYITRTQQFERAGQRLRRIARVAIRRRPHIDTRADTDLDQPFHLQRNQCLAHRGPRNAELARKIALGRQA